MKSESKEVMGYRYRRQRSGNPVSKMLMRVIHFTMWILFERNMHFHLILNHLILILISLKSLILFLKLAFYFNLYLNPELNVLFPKQTCKCGRN